MSVVVTPPLPTFLVIGAQKSATRWLKSNLVQHPQVFVAPGELGFFHDPDRVRELGIDGYRSQFSGWQGEPIVGEGTPGYLIWHHNPSDVSARIDETLPEVRLVALLRNPVDRAASAHRHHIRWENLDPRSDLLELARTSTPPSRRPTPYIQGWGGPQTLISGGWYAASLEPYIDRFGDRLLVILHDDIQADPAGCYRSVLDHLGADPSFVPSDLEAVEFTYQKAKRRPLARRGPSLGPDERAELFGYFDDDVNELEGLLGRDLSIWRP